MKILHLEPHLHFSRPEIALKNQRNLEEILVTAQRRTERITDVPISITAFGQEEADRRGVFDIGGVARITPNLTLANFGNTISRVSIRGVDSDAGAGTTGAVYLTVVNHGADNAIIRALSPVAERAGLPGGSGRPRLARARSPRRGRRAHGCVLRCRTGIQPSDD